MKRAEIGYWVLWRSLLKTEEILSFLKTLQAVWWIIYTGQQVFIKTEFHF